MLLDVSLEMEDVPRNDGETKSDLGDKGYDVCSCEVIKENKLDKDTLQKVINNLTENIDEYQDRLNKLITNNQVGCAEELRQNTKINGMKITRKKICGNVQRIA